MSFRSEAAKVRANIAAGNYKEPRDYFSGFADQIAAGIRRQDEAKRQEELEKRREARANARAIAKAQREEDKKVQAQEKLVNGYLTVKGYDVTDENKNAVRSVVTNLGITGFADLDAIMKQSSTYVEGTPQADIDAQMDALGQLRQGDGPFEAESARINNLSSEGRIEFGQSRGKNVLEMEIDEVRYELSNQSITEDRRAELERRLASFGEADYISTEMFHEDGRKATPRNAKEEQDLRDLGFKSIQPADPSKFPERFVYKEGAKLKVFTQEKLNQAITAGWSEEEPAEEKEFKPFDMFAADGRKVTIRNQEMADQYGVEGSEFGFVQPAPDKSYSRTLYMNGAKYTVTSEEEENAALAVGWSKVEPADKPDFVPQDLYLNGSEVRVTTQEQFDEYEDKGYKPVKPANHGQMLTAKQAALQSFMEEEGVSDLQGEDYRNKLAEFERKWEEQSKAVKDKQESYTSANYTADLIKFGSMAISDNEAERKEAAEWFNTTKPIIESSLNVVSGMDDAAKVEALVESGIDRQRALGIVNGTIKVTSDGFGRPVIVDTSTNQQSEIGGTETLEDATSRIVESTLTEEEKANLAAARLEMEEALKASGFSGSIEDLENVQAAFGPEGFFGKIGNKFSGIFNQTMAPNTADAATTLDSLVKVTKFNIISAFPGLRDSVQLKAEIEDLLPKSQQFWYSKPDALRDMKAIKDLLDQSIINQKNIIDSVGNTGNINTAAESKANVAIRAITPLSKLYDQLIKSIEGKQESDTKGVTDSVFKNTGGTNTTDQSLPVVSGTDDPKFKNLKAGEKFIYNGDTYTKN